MSLVKYVYRYQSWFTSSLLMAVLCAPFAVAAEDRVNARILEYEDGSRRLERVETPGKASNYGTVSTANARKSAALVGGSGARGAGAAAAGGGGGGAAGRTAGAGGRSGGLIPKVIPPGEGVELIVGGKSEGGVAAKTTMPIIE